MQMQMSQGERVHGGNVDRNGAGGLISSIPEDIIMEVLIRLPANSLCRFRCVCKAWLALISDRALVAAQRSGAGPLMVAAFGPTTDQRHEVRLLDMRGNVLKVFGVWGGTALLAPTRLSLVFVNRAGLGAMVMDPASERDFTIIRTDKDPLPSSWWGPMLRLTNMSRSDYSFGRAAVSGDYKVLRLVTSSEWGGDRRQRCEVATVTDGGAKPTWRQTPWGPFLDEFFSWKDKATVNGILYFMPFHPCPESHGRDRIAAFDLDSEEWKLEMIKCPPLEHSKEDNISLTELRGTLCVVQRNVSPFGGHYVNLWLVMDPDKSIWVKEYIIHMPERFCLFMKPLDVSGDGTRLLLLNATQKVGNDFRYILQFYNSNTEDFTDVMEMADGFNGTITFYPGSLLS